MHPDTRTRGTFDRMQHARSAEPKCYQLFRVGHGELEVAPPRRYAELVAPELGMETGLERTMPTE